MKRLLLASLFVLCGRSAWAQDFDAMLKWTTATVVHYKVVGEFSRAGSTLWEARLLTPVSDRVEIEFDWNQEAHKLVGKPVIKNFPSKAGAIVTGTGCPPAKVTGTFEFFTMLSLKDNPDEIRAAADSGLIMDVRADYPAGELPTLAPRADATCGSAWETFAAKSATTSEVLIVPLAMMLAMGKAGGADITPDGKSLVSKTDAAGVEQGWTWTFTPTIVK